MCGDRHEGKVFVLEDACDVDSGHGLRRPDVDLRVRGEVRWALEEENITIIQRRASNIKPVALCMTWMPA